MPQRDQRLAVAAGDGPIRDLEGVGFDPAAVLAVDRGFGDLTRRIRDQLLASGGKFGQIVGERGSVNPHHRCLAARRRRRSWASRRCRAAQL